jgi:hypothetical protein
MLLELVKAIMTILAGLTLEQVQILLGSKKGILQTKLQEVFEVTFRTEVVLNDPYSRLRREWEGFYNQYFGIIVDFSGVIIPTAPSALEGIFRIIFVPQGLTLKQVIAAMRNLFKVWVWNEELDSVISVNTRTSAKTYAVWVRNGLEPDAMYLGRSTRDADMTGAIGVTLIERLVLETKHFTETKNHLDVKGVTLCTGSRDSDGDVPGVYWRPAYSEVYVYGYGVDGSNPYYGLREAVL